MRTCVYDLPQWFHVFLLHLLHIYIYIYIFLKKKYHESSRTPQHSEWNCVGTNRPQHRHMYGHCVWLNFEHTKNSNRSKKNSRRRKSNSNLPINSKNPRNRSKLFGPEWYIFVFVQRWYDEVKASLIAQNSSQHGSVGMSACITRDTTEKLQKL